MRTSLPRRVSRRQCGVALISSPWGWKGEDRNWKSPRRENDLGLTYGLPSLGSSMSRVPGQDPVPRGPSLPQVHNLSLFPLLVDFVDVEQGCEHGDRRPCSPWSVPSSPSKPRDHFVRPSSSKFLSLSKHYSLTSLPSTLTPRYSPEYESHFTCTQ